MRNTTNTLRVALAHVSFVTLNCEPDIRYFQDMINSVGDIDEVSLTLARDINSPVEEDDSEEPVEPVDVIYRRFFESHFNLTPDFIDLSQSAAIVIDSQGRIDLLIDHPYQDLNYVELCESATILDDAPSLKRKYTDADAPERKRHDSSGPSGRS